MTTRRLISGEKREDDVQDASLRPQTLADFFGQAAIAGMFIWLALKELAR